MDLAGLHIISTGKQPLQDFSAIAATIHPLVAAFHLREKTRTARELLEAIASLSAAGVPLAKIIVNDRADVAAAALVRGVQLGHQSLEVGQAKRLFPQLTVGKSAHSAAEAKQAAKDGADYVIFGHIYPTPSKPGLPSQGLEALERVVRETPVPVLAIGGIRPENVQALRQLGAAGIAVMSGVLEAAHPVRAAEAYHNCWQNYCWQMGK